MSLKKSNVASFVILAVLCIGLYNSAKYELDDYDQVVVTQFGKIVGKPKTVPGEYFKLPFIQETHYFPKHQFMDVSVSHMPSRDKKFITLKTKAYWKIADPVKYMQKLNSDNLAYSHARNSIGEAQRTVVTSYSLVDLVGDKASLPEFEDIDIGYDIQRETQTMAAKAFPEFGLELITLKMQATFPYVD